MLKNPTIEQRIERHIENQKHCKMPGDTKKDFARDEKEE